MPDQSPSQSTSHRSDAVTAETLRPGIDWLASEQAPDAKVSQFGIGTKISPYSVQITPSGKSGDNRGSVVIFTLLESERVYDGSFHRELINGIEIDERERLEVIVSEFGRVLDCWNGESKHHTSCSFQLDIGVGAGIARAFRNYCSVGLSAGRMSPRVETPEGWW